jgi:hypothetical protein
LINLADGAVDAYQPARHAQQPIIALSASPILFLSMEFAKIRHQIVLQIANLVIIKAA